MHNEQVTTLLTAPELEAIDSRLAANAQKWLTDNATPCKVKPLRKQKSTTGPKPKTVVNPFYGFIGSMTAWERYPRFAMDIIEGVARLDWHDRPIGASGKSMPLSVQSIALILEWLPEVTNESVEILLNLKERHARRYLTAISLIIPWMMKSRPTMLIDYMEGINSTQKNHDWEDCNESTTPSPEEIQKLHYDLRTLNQYNSEEEYDSQVTVDGFKPTIAQLPIRSEHPMKARVMQMLREGVPIKPIARETGVDPKTIRKWRAEAAEHESLQAA
ncbi:helix-turn-helix domain-containing protein [Pseudomonas phoenicis]|uniref:helix-turn-helix domain-containing protein n=1 Tax=unclassified Pseudomonas TaxID=196821 RepID=UPI0039A091E5